MQIQRFYRGKLIADNAAFGEFKIIATSKDIDPEDAADMFSSAYCGTYNGVDIGEFTQAFVWGQHKDQYTLTKIEKSKVRDRGTTFPVYHTLIIPKSLLVNLGYDNFALINWLDSQTSDFPHFSHITSDLSPLQIEQDILAYKTQNNTKLELPEKIRKTILNLVVYGQRITIAGMTPGLPERLNMVRNLTSKLPSPVRADITFATHILNNSNGNANAQLQILLNTSSKPDPNIPYLNWGNFELSNVVDIPINAYIKWIESQKSIDWKVVNNAFSTIIRKVSHQPRHQLLEILGQHFILLDEGLNASVDLIYYNLVNNPMLLLDEQKELIKRLMVRISDDHINLLDIIIERDWIRLWNEDILPLFRKQPSERVLSLLNRWIQKYIDSSHIETIIEFFLQMSDILHPLWAARLKDYHLFSNLLLRLGKLEEYTNLFIEMLNKTKGESAVTSIEYIIERKNSEISSIMSFLNPELIEYPQWLADYYLRLWSEKNYLPEPQINWLAKHRLENIIDFPEYSFDFEVLRYTNIELKQKLLNVYIEEANKNLNGFQKAEIISQIIAAFYFDPEVFEFTPFTYNPQDLVEAIDKIYNTFRTSQTYFLEQSLSDEKFNFIQELVLSQKSQMSEGLRKSLANKCIEISELIPPKKGVGLFNRNNKLQPISPGSKPDDLREVFLWIAGCLLSENVNGKN